MNIKEKLVPKYESVVENIRRDARNKKVQMKFMEKRFQTTEKKTNKTMKDR